MRLAGDRHSGVIGRLSDIPTDGAAFVMESRPINMIEEPVKNSSYLSNDRGLPGCVTDAGGRAKL